MPDLAKSLLTDDIKKPFKFLISLLDQSDVYIEEQILVNLSYFYRECARISAVEAIENTDFFKHLPCLCNRLVK